MCLYRTQTGEERRGSIADMIADNGEFLRMLSGNRFEDLDRMLAYEKERIHEQYENAPAASYHSKANEPRG